MMTLPQVFIIVATTADGFIAQETYQASTNWTSKEDNELFHQLTKEAGVVVMGETTFGTIPAKYLPMSNRLNVIYSHLSREELVNKFKIDPNNVTDDTLRVTSLQPQELVENLAHGGYEKITICGGSSIYTQFLQAGVVDKLYITIEPIIFGSGIKLFNQPVEQKLKLVNSKRLNEQGSILMEYDCIK
ncbi:MAG: Bifunctional deaminase-reductase domain protein [Microgenomates bacterium 39_7]|nr:MAG: Bifunctional deaminase-reductase domain protein [Microgenomates bacterium 39_7]